MQKDDKGKKELVECIKEQILKNIFPYDLSTKQKNKDNFLGHIGLKKHN